MLILEHGITYVVQFLERMPSLKLINSLPLCEGKIIRVFWMCMWMCKFFATLLRENNQSILDLYVDVYVTCYKILPYITKMKVDENR